MKRITIVALLLFTVAIFALSGCGSGGGSGSQAPTQVVVKLSTQGTAAANSIIGVGLNLILPAGVTVKADSAGKTNGGVVVASSSAAGADVLAKYSPATSTPGSVNIEVTKTSGFNPGEFVTVTCDLAAGSSSKSTDFSVTDFKPVDQTGTTISVLSVSLTSEIK